MLFRTKYTTILVNAQNISGIFVATNQRRDETRKNKQQAVTVITVSCIIHETHRKEKVMYKVAVLGPELSAVK